MAAIKTVKSDEEAGSALRIEPAEGNAELQPGDPVVLVISGGPTGKEN